MRPTFSTVMMEAFNIMQHRLTRMRLAGDLDDDGVLGISQVVWQFAAWALQAIR